MTLNEFRAWLDGYQHSFEGGAPNAEQWARVTEKLASVLTEVALLMELQYPQTFGPPQSVPCVSPNTWASNAA